MSISNTTGTSKTAHEGKTNKGGAKGEGERALSAEAPVLDLGDRKGASDKKMKHLWMVEDVPASPNREARSYWTKIGVAFENRDGSWRLELAAIPVNGRLQMRDPAPRQEVAA